MDTCEGPIKVFGQKIPIAKKNRESCRSAKNVKKKDHFPRYPDFFTLTEILSISTNN